MAKVKGSKSKKHKSTKKSRKGIGGRKPHPAALRSSVVGISLYNRDLDLLKEAQKKRGLKRGQAVRLGLRMLAAVGFKLDDVAKAELTSQAAGKAAHAAMAKSTKNGGAGWKKAKVAKKAKAVKTKSKRQPKAKKSTKRRPDFVDRLLGQAKKSKAAKTIAKAQARRDRKNAKLREKRAAAKQKDPLPSIGSGTTSVPSSPPITIEAHVAEQA